MILTKEYSWGRGRQGRSSDSGPLRFLWFWIRRGADASAKICCSVMRLLAPKASPAGGTEMPPAFATDETVDTGDRTIRVRSAEHVELHDDDSQWVRPEPLPDKPVRPVVQSFPLGLYRRRFNAQPANRAAWRHYVVADQRPAFEQIERLLGEKRFQGDADWALVVDSRPKEIDTQAACQRRD